MGEHTTEAVGDVLDRPYHAESRRIPAVLIRLPGHLDGAQERWT